MKHSLSILLTTAAGISISNAALTLHSTFDNADVGAGAGNDISSTPFTVNDLISGNNGTARNVVDNTPTSSAHVTSGAVGQHGEALTFQRDSGLSNRAVEYGDIQDIGTGSYTVAMWFNTSSTATTQGLAAKGQTSGSTSEGWTIFIENNSIITRLGSGSATNRASQSISIAGLADSWQHLAFVVDNTAGTVTGYLNGSNAGWINGGGGPGGNTFTAGTDIDTTDELRLGILGNGADEFRGDLDDFRIYNEALDAAGVIDAMNAVPEPSSTALLGLGTLALIARRRK